MPSLSLNQPLVSAGASAANDWADASADTQITVAAGVSLKRGACAEVDIGALATADAGLQKFIRLEARGNAFAEARASVQLQFTLNAFEKLGFTIGAQAKAQAAAGLEVGLGISVGDFIQILKENTEARGLPFDLAMVLLEEVSIQAGVRVHVAASAAAYAELSGTLNLVARAGTKPGFFFRTKAGLGLAAGVGFGASFGCGFQDPGRCYGRVVDRLVNAVGDAVDAQVAGSSREMRDIAATLRPVARIALRHAWELGHFLAERGASGSGISSSELSEKAVQVVVEECQEFLFGSFVGHSVESLRNVLSGNAAGFTDIVWKRIAPQRQAMAAALRAAPEEPFVFSAENVAYWSDLASKAADLVTAIPTTSRREDFIRAASLLYAASRLLLRISESRVVRTSAYAQAIGAGRTSTPTPGIAGRIDPQPAPAICAHINAVLNRSATTKLGYEDLIPFLTQDAVLDPLRRRFPQVDAFLKVFSGTLGTVENALFRELVAIPDFRGPRSAQAFLRILVQALDAHVETRVLGQLGPEVNRRTADPNVRLYFNEVILGTLRFTKDLTLRTVLDWDAHPPNRDDFLEILSSVALMPVTRSAVVLFDGLLTAVQRNLKASFLHASTTLTGPKGPFRVLGLSPDPALLALVKTVVASGGEIFGPLPDETRTRLRHALYEVMELLPPGSATSFQRQLEDDFFIPNLEALSSLKDELLAISQVRFGKFVETMVDAGGAAAAALIEAACAAAVQ
ncbi:MAG: hypothetical protein JNL10_10390, partial [Verrucomicrobiales bacterium]|nr:hypothetical protein [Verrucomicrobiales bacterium]